LAARFRAHHLKSEYPERDGQAARPRPLLAATAAIKLKDGNTRQVF